MAFVVVSASIQVSSSSTFMLQNCTMDDNDNTHLMAIFQDESGKPVQECLRNGSYLN